MKQINDLTGDQTQDTKMSCPDGLTRTCSGLQQVVTSIAWVQLAGAGVGGGFRPNCVKINCVHALRVTSQRDKNVRRRSTVAARELTA